MTWLGWQIDYLLLLQNFRNITNGFFDQFFLFISQLGIMPFTVIALCVIYWGINKKAGIYMLYCYSFSFLMNIFLKFTACIYRPWILDARIQPTAEAFSTAPGYSFPSGHTAGASSFWGSLAIVVNKKPVTILCILIIFLVMLSRNYLGVHTPQDVIVSLIVGICIIFGTVHVQKWTEQKDGRDNILMAIITVICILLGIYLVLKSYPMDYKDGILLYNPQKSMISAIARITNIFAIFFGLYLENKFIKFDPSKGSVIRKIILVLIGLVIFFAIETQGYKLLKHLIDPIIAKHIVRFTTGFLITFIYPCVIKLTDKLLSKKQPDNIS